MSGGGKSVSGRRFLAPEVVQTSAMDCGPASLKCLLEGFGVRASYGRLREACQTDVDGASIDTIEEVAGQLGLEAEQIMLPVDHLLSAGSGALPAIVIVRMPNGLTHFVVAWRRHGRFVQVMDPATGRKWMTCQRFLGDVYWHELPIPATQFRSYAKAGEFLEPLRKRLAEVGVGGSERRDLIEDALADESWRALAALDAATRMTTAMVESGGLARGAQAKGVLRAFFERERIGGERDSSSLGIPESYWFARATEPGEDGEEQTLLRGAVVIRVSGLREALEEEEAAEALSPELAAALTEPPSRPGATFFRFLREDGLVAPAVLLFALVLAAGGVVLEALLFRGLLGLSPELALTGQRLGVMGVLLGFAVILLLLELPLTSSVLRFGRHLENRLRIAFLKKIPLLSDRYFQSRPISDMAERCHSVQKVRLLPELGARFLQMTFALLLTTAGIIWLDPPSALIAVAVAVAAIGVPLLAHPVLSEKDLRVRTHTGALGRFYLDALLGLVPVRVHGAERSVRTEHESLLVEWSRASLSLQRTAVFTEGLQAFLGFGLAAWLVINHLNRGIEPSGILLLVYWALHLPVLGQEISLILRQYPELRSTALRLLEPLGAREDDDTVSGSPPSSSSKSKDSRTRGEQESEHEHEHEHEHEGVRIGMRSISVVAGGHPILREVDLTIASGEHLAVVGSSGAGKSSLAGLLLGWHRPADGDLLVDGQPLTGERLDRLRQETAWVDPAVELWNRTLLENLRYGSTELARPVSEVIEQADLMKVLEKLPEGFQTSLGEGGGLVSGGEGQRVRFARALLRPGVRLVILDEPFRGLDRDKRRLLLQRARQVWRDATLLCITHDVGDTLDFERVLVLGAGRIVEDDVPERLAGQEGSLFRRLLEAEDAVRREIWSGPEWRRLWLEGGALSEAALASGKGER